jgi:hypothetical protein
MQKTEVLHAWATILSGRAPSLSIEITKECPLRCPGCYAFDSAHLGSNTLLRQLSDFKGDELVTRILALLDRQNSDHEKRAAAVKNRRQQPIQNQTERRDTHCELIIDLRKGETLFLQFFEVRHR